MNLRLLCKVMLCVIFSSPSIFGQQLKGEKAQTRVNGSKHVILNEKTNAIKGITLLPKIYDSLNLSLFNKQVFGSRLEDTWVLKKTERDQIGMIHSRFQQHYKGLKVAGYVYIYHFKDGYLTSANGDFFPNISLETTPQLSTEQALNYSLAKSDAKLSSNQLDFKEVELVVFIHEEHPVLAYKCIISSKAPLLNNQVFVDANSGAILKVIDNICSIDVVGTAHTHFSGVKTVTTDSIAPSTFISEEYSRGNGIKTYSTETLAPFYDTDNNWNNTNTENEEFGMDVHYGVEATFDFYMNQFNRSSYDGNGGLLISYVNDPFVMVNAYWTGYPFNEMYYGNGDVDHYPVASLEIVGHEFTHGVTQNTADLFYSDQSGALNESFSDIFGATIRFLNAPSVATWYVGDQLLKPTGTGNTAFRNMANPNEFQHPDCFYGTYYGNGDIVHNDSGIQNYWYYLLVEGGYGVNDLGDSYLVNSIGLMDAMKIAYRNLAYYLPSYADFLGARYGSELAAIDLFGECSPQHNAVINAWYAVGVGDVQSLLTISADFTMSDQISCTAPFTVDFQSVQGYDNYYWNFGDGTTANVFNPSHTYLSNGNYTVSLMVVNNMGCFSSDISVITNAISISPAPLEADFTYTLPNISNLVAGSVISFLDNTSNSPESWNWSFGNGATSNLRNPSYIYANTGFYNVRLIVQNCNSTDTIEKLINIGNEFFGCFDYFITSPNGVLFSTGIDSNSTASYYGCSYYLNPCNASSINFTIDSLHLSANDSIFIYDFYNQTILYQVITMNNYQTNFNINNNNVIVIYRFQNSGTSVQSFFKISYQGIVDQNQPQPVVSMDIQPYFDQFIFSNTSNPWPIYTLWDFGDGTTNDYFYVLHKYLLPGEYVVSLTVGYCDGTFSTIYDTIVTNFLGVETNEIGETMFSLYPNPASEYFTISNSENWTNVSLELLDMAGRSVKKENFSFVDENGINVNTVDFVTGQYILKLYYVLEDGTERLAQKKIQLK